jgi:adenosine/AMP kinase
MMPVDTEIVPIENPNGLNVILGQTHFIKTAEDIHEALIGAVPGIHFGVAFCEASGPCLVRVEGNAEDLKDLAAKNALTVGAGHFFIIFLRDAYPINVLKAVRDVPEVVTIFAASANPVDVVVAKTPRGRGVLGVVDGERTKGIEKAKDRADRIAFLRKIGYKLG